MALTGWVQRRGSRSGRDMKLPLGVGILLIVGVGILVIVGVAAAARTDRSWILNHHEELRNLALVAAGAIGVLLAIWRARVAEHQAETARRSLLNERDQKAAEMLGSPLLSVRLGGIYALQNLAAEHPRHYHLGIMNQFCAFVREATNTQPSPAPAGTDPGPTPTSTRDSASTRPVHEDVRAVMDSIAGRSDAGIEVEQRENRFRLDLRGANLREWRFSEANLFEANLSEADLSEADLRGANLSWADLSEANLSGTKLSRADLRRAKLPGADLRGAKLLEADLSGADLSGADLRGADLRGAKLLEAKLLEAKLPGADLS